MSKAKTIPLYPKCLIKPTEFLPLPPIVAKWNTHSQHVWMNLMSGAIMDDTEHAAKVIEIAKTDPEISKDFFTDISGLNQIIIDIYSGEVALLLYDNGAKIGFGALTLLERMFSETEIDNPFKILYDKILKDNPSYYSSVKEPLQHSYLEHDIVCFELDKVPEGESKDIRESGSDESVLYLDS